MQTRTFWLEVDDGAKLFVHCWEPDAGLPKAAVQIAHGMAEHSARYARVAQRLTSAGYVVYANDHRGHGKTAQKPEDLGFFAAHDGFRRAVRDMVALSERIAQEHPSSSTAPALRGGASGLPLFLLGHSMGSLFTRAYLFENASRLAGVVISGTSGQGSLLARLGIGLASLARWRVGARGVSKLLTLATTGPYNLAFRPNRTTADWLSRDTAEVDKYIADPLCGFDLTVQGWIDVYECLLAIEREKDIARLPKDLPVYLFAGSLDPVGGDNPRGRWLIEALKRAGMKDVTVRFYPDARHETLNELNRDDVERDLLNWLDGALARRARS